ncbi:hypothetical protein B0H13DRAFT_2232591 [Mycena leptocephala]|nr:hypothetical protein B0H13DRAFT_2232591 [Mycena leptocephala]
MFHKRGLGVDLTNWWIPYVAHLRILPDTQVATQRGVQTRDLMSYLLAIKCWAKRHKTTVYTLKRDQMKGFDYLSPQGIHSLNPHLPNDSLTSKITMVEATDDSYIFAHTIPALRRNVLAMEHFQYAYGWQTQWSKSLAYVLEPSGPPPDSLVFDTVTIAPNIDPLTVSTRTVTLRSNELDFLRAKVDDPSSRYDELKSFIDDFTFPKFIRRLPITLIHKIVKQNIIAKARVLLSLQPIKCIDAEDLDTIIKMKIHIDTGMPFAPSSGILTLPIEYRSLDFPSVARINDAIAIDGLHHGRNVSILQGELIGLIMGLILSPVDDPDAILYTDHLNSMRLIEDSRTVVDQSHRLRTMNAQSYYRWILALVARNPLKIVYTRSHTDDLSLPSRINYEADHFASSAQRAIHTVFTAPIPTFTMDDYTFHSHIDGWIESNIRNFPTHWCRPPTAHGPPPLRPITPTEWSYTHAYSAYSAIVQLYAPSGQLPTADTLQSREKLDTPNCRMGCNAIEDMHHIFVDFLRYTEWRTKASNDVFTRLKAKLAEKEIEEADTIDLLHAAKKRGGRRVLTRIQRSLMARRGRL